MSRGLMSTPLLVVQEAGTSRTVVQRINGDDPVVKPVMLYRRFIGLAIDDEVRLSRSR
jgi:hypothetical protein